MASPQVPNRGSSLLAGADLVGFGFGVGCGLVSPGGGRRCWTRGSAAARAGEVLVGAGAQDAEHGVLLGGGDPQLVLGLHRGLPGDVWHR